MSCKRNKKGLTLPPPVLETCKDVEPRTRLIENKSVLQNCESPFESLERQLNELALTDVQKERLNEWLIQKEQIGGDIANADEWLKVSELGYGNGGIVWKLKHKPTGVIIARKLIGLEVKATTRNTIIRELKVLHKCSSPYIVGFYGAFYGEGGISICMEYMDGQSLDVVMKKLGRLSEPVLGKVTFATLGGLLYLKEEFSILHRDIKPPNILVNSRGEIKLCDFGVSVQLINSVANSFVGTRSYMAPERLRGDRYTVHSDIWSLGLSLVELSIGRYPIPEPTAAEYSMIFDRPADDFADISTSKIDENDELHNNSGIGSQPIAIFVLLDIIVNDPSPRLPGCIFSADFIDFIDTCLQKDPVERGSLSSLLSHPFVVKAKSDSVDFAGFIKKSIEYCD